MPDFTPTDFNATVATVAGEAGNQSPDVQRMVASTAINRANLTGKSIGDIVSDPATYNGANTPNAQAAQMGSPTYQTIAKNIAPVFTDGPTTTATHFHSKMDNPPAWDDGSGHKVGDLTFVDRSQDFGKPPTDEELMARFNGGGAPAPITGPTVRGVTVSVEPDDGAAKAAPTDEELMARFNGGGAPDAQPPSSAPVDPLSVYPKAEGFLPRALQGTGVELRALANGVTLGGADRLEAGASALPALIHGGDAYLNEFSKRYADEKMKDAAGAKAYPWSSGVGNVVGGIIPALAMPEVAAPTLAARVGVGAGQGALLAGGSGMLNARGNVKDMGNAGIAPALEGAAFAGPMAAALGGIGPILRSKALSPFMARFSQEAAERQAGNALAGHATNLPAVRSALENGPTEIVPGSIPTTFQQTADPGLGALERGVAARNPAPFAQARGEQNAARVQSLGSVQSGGDPVQVSRFLKDQYDQIDAATEAQVRAAQSKGAASVDAVDQSTNNALRGVTQGAQAKASALGGTGTPEGYGVDVRGAISAAEGVARAREGALWKAIDPDGSLTGNTVQTSKAAKALIKDIPVTAKPPSGEEAAIFSAAAGMKPIAPVSDLIALRNRVSTELRNELIANGRSPTYARLSQLRGAIQDNLAQTISDKVASDNKAVVAGTMPVAQSAGAQYQQAVKDAQIAGQRISFGGSSGGAGAGPATSEGLRAGGNGAEVSPGGATGVPPGNTPVSRSPTFDEAAGQRLSAATEATKTRAATFGLSPVSNVTAKAGSATQFRLPDGEVPGKFFHPGARGYTDMQALQKAAGPAAMPVIEDYAAMSLKRAAMTPDGTIDPAKFARWQASHADALRGLPPETAARFADAASAGQAVADAAVARAEAMKNVQKEAARQVMIAEDARKATMAGARAGPVGKVMNLSEPQDVSRTIGTILGGKTAVADMRDLVGAARNNPDAIAGIRQAVADHIANKFIGNNAAGVSDVSQINANSYQTFMRQNRAALGTVFSDGELNTMDAIAADIRRSKMSESALKNPGGPGTAQDTYAVNSGGPSKGGKTVLDMVGGAIGAAVGQQIGPLAGEGSIAGAVTAHIIQSLRNEGIERVDQLVTRAMVDPRVAKALLEKVPTVAGKTSSVGMSIKMRSLIAALGAARALQPPPTADSQRDTALSGADMIHTLKGRAQAASPNALSGY